MRDAGWLYGIEENMDPEQLANSCLEVMYQGPFELIFYCFYEFPTNYPEDIRKIFGKDFFYQSIDNESFREFLKTIQELTIKAVVSFNKGIYNRVSYNQIARYIEDLKVGELVRSQVKGLEKTIPVYLTFPTGWRYHKEYHKFRTESLVRIRQSIDKEEY